MTVGPRVGRALRCKDSGAVRLRSGGGRGLLFPATSHPLHCKAYAHAVSPYAARLSEHAVRSLHHASEPLRCKHLQHAVSPYAASILEASCFMHPGIMLHASRWIAEPLRCSMMRRPLVEDRCAATPALHPTQIATPPAPPAEPLSPWGAPGASEQASRAQVPGYPGCLAPGGSWSP